MTVPSDSPRSAALASRLTLLALLAAPALAQRPPAVEYTVHLDRPQTQTFEISMRIRQPGEPLRLMLPVWRPGRYAVSDPAGTLRGVTAHVGQAELEVAKEAKATWVLHPGRAREVEVRYTIYANSLGDRTRHVDATHAFLSPSTVFLYSPAHRALPLRVTLEAPAGWRVATGLDAVGADPRVLGASDYDVLVDSPIEVGLHDRIDFQVEGHAHEIAIWPPGALVHAQHLIEDFSEIVAAQATLFGRYPYQRYVFLVHAGAGARGGTEHLNSTIMQTTLEAIEGSRRRTKAYRGFLGLVAHEFFHTWNVKQLRPAGLVPYDYQQENYSPLFWVAEGTTSYYDDLTLARTGLIEPKRYFELLGEAIEGLRTRPGASVQSLAESSFDAWIKFNHSTPDDVNSTVSFYSKGALVSLLLDLRIRELTDDRASLDTVMRRMFERYPLAAGGYTEEELREEVEAVAGSSFAGFFRDFVHGTEALPLEDALAYVGLELYLKPEKEDGDESDSGAADEEDEERADAKPRQRAEIGLLLRDQNGHTMVSTVPSDGPAYAAGVEAGDEIVALEGRYLSADDLARRLDDFAPGFPVTLHLLRHDRLETVAVTLAERPFAKWSVRPLEQATEPQQSAYQAWLGKSWPTEKDSKEDSEKKSEKSSSPGALN